MSTSEPKAVQSITLEDLLLHGLPPHEAHVFYKNLQQALVEIGQCSSAMWRFVSKELLHPKHPHALHRLMYDAIYTDWDYESKGPPPAWFPTQELARETNLGRLMEVHGKRLLGSSYYSPIESFTAFQKFSADHPQIYWPLLLNELSVHFYVQPKCVFSAPDESRPNGTWLPGAVLNAAECCLLPKPSHGKTDFGKAIIWRTEGQTSLHSMTYAELRKSVNRVANALDLLGLEKGDVIAIDMPMSTNSIIIYLAVILAGYVMASIADSFSPQEIATRMRISKAKAVFTQDVILRGGKTIPLYSRVLEAKSPMIIVLPANENDLQVILRNGDFSWNTFLAPVDHLSRPWDYQAVQQPIESLTNILFSSGTSGDPKALPYSHLQPLRLAADTWAHLDVKVGDVFVWPTNLGWMVGPMLVYSSFLSGATIGIYIGSPLLRGFGEFVQDAGATVLGTVPSIVKTWRKSSCMDGLDWSKIRVLSSTGEASNIDDDLWLSSRAFYKPVLEPCGGTELAAGFLQGCLLQPQALAAMSTPSMTTSLVILNDQKLPYPDNQPCIGELTLMPMFGASHSLLNGDHNKIYYEDMPMHKGMKLRRHGDIFERTAGGFYKSHGRSDDTMNLGGIKTSAVEIERVCNKASEHIIETAAVAVPPPGGGPDQLVVFVVLADAAGPNFTTDYIRKALTKALQTYLNPYFKVSLVVIVAEFPRTATNKVLRRVLRSQAMEAQKLRSKL